MFRRVPVWHTRLPDAGHGALLRWRSVVAGLALHSEAGLQAGRTLVNDDVELSISQFVGAWDAFCAMVPDSDREVQPGMSLLFTGIPIPFFNVAFQTRPVPSAADLRALGADACAFAADRGVPWFLIVTHEAIPAGVDASAVLGEVGLRPATTATGMLAEDVEPLTRVPDGLELIEPRDDATSAAMITVNSAAYAMDMSAAIKDIGAHRTWKDHSAVVGRVSSMPVACSATLMVDGYRYVAFVATHPDHQRRGYADAAMRRSLDLAAERSRSRRPTVLHATEAGRPVYEKMGYAPLSAHTMFLHEDFFPEQ